MAYETKLNINGWVAQIPRITLTTTWFFSEAGGMQRRPDVSSNIVSTKCFVRTNGTLKFINPKKPSIQMEMQEMKMQQKVKTPVENLILPKSPRSIPDPKPCSAHGVVTQLLSMSANETRTPGIGSDEFSLLTTWWWKWGSVILWLIWLLVELTHPSEKYALSVKLEDSSFQVSGWT